MMLTTCLGDPDGQMVADRIWYEVFEVDDTSYVEVQGEELVFAAGAAGDKALQLRPSSAPPADAVRRERVQPYLALARLAEEVLVYKPKEHVDGKGDTVLGTREYESQQYVLVLSTARHVTLLRSGDDLLTCNEPSILSILNENREVVGPSLRSDMMRYMASHMTVLLDILRSCSQLQRETLPSLTLGHKPVKKTTAARVWLKKHASAIVRIDRNSYIDTASGKKHRNAAQCVAAAEQALGRSIVEDLRDRPEQYPELDNDDVVVG